MTHRLYPDKAQKYHFTTTVSWVFISSETATLELPPPNLFFSVPDDIFYPFKVGSSGGEASNLSRAVKIASTIVLFILTI